MLFMEGPIGIEVTLFKSHGHYKAVKLFRLDAVSIIKSSMSKSCNRKTIQLCNKVNLN